MRCVSENAFFALSQHSAPAAGGSQALQLRVVAHFHTQHRAQTQGYPQTEITYHTTSVSEPVTYMRHARGSSSGGMAGSWLLGSRIMTDLTMAGRVGVGWAGIRRRKGPRYHSRRSLSISSPSPTGSASPRQCISRQATPVRESPCAVVEVRGACAARAPCPLALARCTVSV